MFDGGSVPVLILLVVTSLQVAAMLLILLAVLRQGSRISRLAHQTEDLAKHAEESNEMLAHEIHSHEPHSHEPKSQG